MKARASAAFLHKVTVSLLIVTTRSTNLVAENGCALTSLSHGKACCRGFALLMRSLVLRHIWTRCRLAFLLHIRCLQWLCRLQPLHLCLQCLRRILRHADADAITTRSISGHGASALFAPVGPKVDGVQIATNTEISGKARPRDAREASGSEPICPKKKRGGA